MPTEEYPAGGASALDPYLGEYRVSDPYAPRGKMLDVTGIGTVRYYAALWRELGRKVDDFFAIYRVSPVDMGWSESDNYKAWNKVPRELLTV